MTLLRISEKEYNEARGSYMTAHSLQQFKQCPRTFYDLKNGLMERKSGNEAAFLFGRAFHCLVLEGEEEFEKRYVVADGPLNEKTGKPYGRDTQKYADWASGYALDGKDVISFAEYTDMQQMGASIVENANALLLLDEGEPEVTVRYEMAGVAFQSRIDWLNGHKIVDLKTCKNLDDFKESADKYGYGLQAAVYLEAMRLETGKAHEYFIIAVEKEAPFRCGVFMVFASLMEPIELAGKYKAMSASSDRADWPSKYCSTVLPLHLGA
jgi:hypothetical protein